MSGQPAGPRPNLVLRIDADLSRRITSLAGETGADCEAVVVAGLAATLFRYDRTPTRPVLADGRLRTVAVSGEGSFRELAATMPEPAGSGEAPAEVGLRTDAEGHVTELTVTLDADWPAALGRSFEHLLRHGTAEPDTPVAALSLLSAAEAEQVVREAGRRVTAFTPSSSGVHHPFERMAAREPDRPALITDGETVTYGQLDARADRFAAHLAELGAGPECRVGLYVERTPELVVAMLAVLKAGASFVPLDRRTPRARVERILRSADARLVVAGSGTRREVSGLDVPVVTEGDSAGTTPDRGVRAGVAPDQAAVTYFTSGSAGQPKGVVLGHRCVSGRIDWITRRYALGPGSVVLHKTPLIFDVALIEVFAPLGVGAAVRMVAPGAEADVGYLADVLGTERIDFVHFVPSVLKAFLGGTEGRTFPGVRWVQTSGEAMPSRLLEGVRDRFPAAEFHAAYGQTETSEVACWEGSSFGGGPTVPVGHQVGLYRVLVLDEHLNPVPAGVPGEICVAGAGGLARGYHRQPELTAQRFVPDPWPLAPGERLYRTGDLGVAGEDGGIAFLGRADDQVKIRGARVELAEVESVLAAAPDVLDCAVLARPDAHGDLELVAYLLGPAVSTGDLAAWAAARLPGYMVPSAYVRLAEWPLTKSGKLARAELPRPSAADRVAAKSEDGTSSASELEAELCGLVAGILRIDELGPLDDFFLVGGNSLRVTQVMVRVRALFGVRLAVAEFFEEPTVRRLAALIERELSIAVSALSDEDVAQRIASVPGSAVTR
ncbi:non-ribosomal peptide synthetase [Amycolatopsis sp. lyj-23]|uniref:non-ribosomal peptide synthetase n=1 Tax=Amycolatopsis sp. lyj-23 TaxID=2789283 RepID=UPI00397953AD